MQNLTDSFLLYRNTARSVWNAGFWPYEKLRNWDNRDRFGGIKQILFEAIVLSSDLTRAASKFLVLPKTEQVPIMIEQPRPGDNNHYWDAPLTTLKRDGTVLVFLDFFDWDELACLDFRYYKVKIAALPTHIELIGREALVEVEHADVYCEG